MIANDDMGPATLHYGDGEYAVLRPGRFVLGAESGAPIPVAALRYWSAERQEAYAGPVEFMTRTQRAKGG